MDGRSLRPPVVIVRADKRFRSEHGGIVTWHSFSAGAYYDPARLSHGDLVGCDEHVVEPGAGFDWHAHRGVQIASWVLAGALRHQDARGADRVVEPGELLVQDARAGVRHRETCASAVPLRFVQLTALSGRFEVWTTSGPLPDATWYLFVAAGTWTVGTDVLTEGDAASGAGHADAPPATTDILTTPATALLWSAP